MRHDPENMGPLEIGSIIVGTVVGICVCFLVALLSIGGITVCRALSERGTFAPASLEGMLGTRVTLKCPNDRSSVRASGEAPRSTQPLAQTHYAICSSEGTWGQGCLDHDHLLVFVHGYADNVESLTSGMQGGMARHLVAKGLCVLAFDWVGHGFSDAPEGPITAEDVADQLEALLEHLEIQRPFHLLGFSFGALCASIFAARHPDRVKRFLILAPFRGHLPFSRTPVWSVWVAFMGLLSLIYPNFQSWGVPPLRTLCQVMLNFDCRRWAPALSAISKASFPVLVAFGGRDDHWLMGIQKHARRVHTQLPRSKMYVFDGSDHLSWYMGSPEQQHEARRAFASFFAEDGLDDDTKPRLGAIMPIGHT